MNQDFVLKVVPASIFFPLFLLPKNHARLAPLSKTRLRAEYHLSQFINIWHFLRFFPIPI